MESKQSRKEMDVWCATREGSIPSRGRGVVDAATRIKQASAKEDGEQQQETRESTRKSRNERRTWSDSLGSPVDFLAFAFPFPLHGPAAVERKCPPNRHTKIEIEPTHKSMRSQSRSFKPQSVYPRTAACVSHFAGLALAHTCFSPYIRFCSGSLAFPARLFRRIRIHKDQERKSGRHMHTRKGSIHTPHTPARLQAPTPWQGAEPKERKGWVWAGVASIRVRGGRLLVLAHNFNHRKQVC